jgi:hypothetical protein
MNLAFALFLLAASQGGAASPPRELACLARHYAIEPRFAAGAWFAHLPDGTRVPFDDGKAKTFAERLAAPDIEDMFAIPYRPGPIRPVSVEDEDPGRVRVEGIFAATYGPRPAALQIRVRFLGLPVRVHRRVAPALARVAGRLARARRQDPSLAPFLARLSGSFVDRKIAGTTRTSAHAFGIAIDLDAAQSDYWRWRRQPQWRNRIPQAIVDAFEAEGFIWGGRWYHYDTMHFEYRPELFGPPCREPASP